MHTGEIMFNLFAKFFDCICREWQKIIVGIETDGAYSMTGRVQGLTTQFYKGVLTGIMRVWCRDHQLDFLLQDLFQNILGEQFYSTLTAFIAYLRQQKNLILEM